MKQDSPDKSIPSEVFLLRCICYKCADCGWRMSRNMLLGTYPWRLVPLLFGIWVACCATPAFTAATGELPGPQSRTAQEQIAAYESAPPDKRPSDITRVLYNGKPAYVISSPCCDQFNYMYDADGQRICAPSGGFTGQGDGRCTGVISIEHRPAASGAAPLSR